ncbi:MAG TPA: glycosyl hydrolase 108 family protein [Phenylobacterium sp.]
MSNARLVGGVSAAALAIIGGVVAIEGGYVNHRNDPGGATNHGMTEKVARANGYQGDMRALPKEFAVQVYNKDYIVKPGFEPFLALSPAVAEELIDTGVNTGPARPSRWLQSSLNAFSQQGRAYPQITVDGRVGPATVAAYQGLQKARGKVKACELIVKSLDAQQGAYYVSISASNPKLQSFTAGWFDHRIGNVPLSRCSEGG